ncbi:inositol monophosphatase [Egicoccus sp. AB-alg2]|uniref:inositol monophosphatase family protein n=1 Tax=Egicoccus sp. AB-alg2 TaxID=3242693 RepID=UPI00359D2B57
MATADDVGLAHHLADLADAVTAAAFTGATLSHETKADGSPVTATDLQVERTILAALADARPGDAVLGEEIGAVGAARRTWVVDGIDGTVHFVRGRPGWATEIALVVDGVVTYGISTSPGLGRRWWGGPEHPAEVADLPPASPTTSRSGPPMVARQLAVAAGGLPGPVTSLPSRASLSPAHAAALATLAGGAGHLDGPVHGALRVAAGEALACLHVRGGPWDFAAFAAIVAGAGGRCTDLHGAPRLDHGGPVLYSNGRVHDEVLALLGHPDV